MRSSHQEPAQAKVQSEIKKSQKEFQSKLRENTQQHTVCPKYCLRNASTMLMNGDSDAIWCEKCEDTIGSNKGDEAKCRFSARDDTRIEGRNEPEMMAPKWTNLIGDTLFIARVAGAGAVTHASETDESEFEEESARLV
jgi:hypothetical protein